MIKYQLAHLTRAYSMNTLKYPISVYFKVTSNCMLNCSFCSQGDMKKESMDISKAKATLMELKKLGVSLVTYTGGEPLLYRFIDELAEYGKLLGFTQVLVTNGLYLKKKQDIVKYFDVIGVSIHGSQATHDALTRKDGSYSKAIDNLAYIKGKYPNIKININYTVSETNLNDNDINSVFDFCKSNNYKLSFARINYIGLSKNKSVITNYNDLLKKVSSLKEEYSNIDISNCIISCAVDQKYEYLIHSCGAGMSFCSIEPNFDVKICPSTYNILGNLYQSSFKKVWRTKKLKEFKKLKWVPLQCQSCKSFERCKNGCHAECNKDFEKETCDALFIAKRDELLHELEDRKIYLRINQIKREGKNYILINYPATITNKTGYKIIKSITNNLSFSDLVRLYRSESNIEDFLLCLYRDGIIGVSYEK